MPSRKRSAFAAGGKGWRPGANRFGSSATKAFTNVSRPRARSSACHAFTASWTRRREFSRGGGSSSSFASTAARALPFRRDLPVPDQLREFAIGAERVGMIAKVAHDLQQALLHGGAAKLCYLSSAQQAVARQAQNGVVLRRGPGEVAAFRFCL